MSSLRRTDLSFRLIKALFSNRLQLLAQVLLEGGSHRSASVSGFQFSVFSSRDHRSVGAGYADTPSRRYADTNSHIGPEQNDLPRLSAPHERECFFKFCIRELMCDHG